MTTNVQIDLEQLLTFIAALKSFNANLQNEWGKTKARWRALQDSWRDPECDKFLEAGGWQQVINQMDRYLASSDEYVRNLERKAEPLKHYRGW